MSHSRKSVSRHAAVIGALTGVSRVLGLVREMLTAQLFGTAALQSAFVVAFTIPNLFRRLFGEGALSAAFIPAFSRSRTEDGEEEALLMANRVLTGVGVLLMLMVGAGIVGAWIVQGVAVPGGKTALTLPLLRIMLPYAFFICLTALCMGMLNVLGDFRTPAFTPVLLNVVWIAVLVAVCPFLPARMSTRITAVAIAIPLAGVLQLGLLWRTLRKKGRIARPRLGGMRDRRVRQVWRQALPAALGAGAVQINVCVDFWLAYWAADWAPSTLTYADRILYLPLGMVATAYGTVLLPVLSNRFAAGDMEGARGTLRSSLTDLIYLMTPAVAGLMVLATPIVSTLFERGNFTPESTIRTARALICYAPGLLVFTVHKVLNPIFYSMGDTKTPMKVSVAAIALNLALNITFILTWDTEWKHAGIATSTVLCSGISSFVLARIAAGRIGSLGWLSIGKAFVRALAASLVMGFCAYHLWGFLGVRAPKAIALLAATFGSALVYGAALFALNPAETLRFAGNLRKLRRKR